MFCCLQDHFLATANLDYNIKMPIFRIMGGQQSRRNNSSENSSLQSQTSSYPAQRAAAANARNTYPGNRTGATAQSLNSAPSNSNSTSRRPTGQFSHSAPPSTTTHQDGSRSQPGTGSNTVVRGAPTDAGGRTQTTSSATDATTRPGAYQVTRTTTGVSSEDVRRPLLENAYSHLFLACHRV